MGVADTYDILWILKVCVWCGFHITPETLEHTTDTSSGDVFVQHRGTCPTTDPLEDRQEK